MSSTEDKIKGDVNEAAGKIKQGVGEATDNDSLKRDGQVQEVKGDAQHLKGEVKDTIKDTVDRA